LARLPVHAPALLPRDDDRDWAAQYPIHRSGDAGSVELSDPIEIYQARRSTMRQLSTAATIAAIAALIASTIGLVAEAALTDISTVPLASSSSVVVKPNLLLTMDTSGSMGWDFMPDNVNPVVPNVNPNDYPWTTSSQDYPY